MLLFFFGEAQAKTEGYMKEKYRIVIADDHTILREALKALLSSDPSFEVVGEAEDGREAIQVVKKFIPDLILIDLSMPKLNGMDAIKEIKKQSSETKVLVLTVHKTEEHLLASLQSGADGYISKDATHSELEIAIRSVLGGKSYLSPEISEKVIEGYLEGRKTLRSRWDTVTQREREVLKLVAEGYTNKEIADLLFVSVKTVEKHRANLMKKLDLHNVSALTAFAMKRGLITR
jgi:DNA-binding NarL/FixJ family response regulator